MRQEWTATTTTTISYIKNVMTHSYKTQFITCKNFCRSIVTVLAVVIISSECSSNEDISSASKNTKVNSSDLFPSSDQQESSWLIRHFTLGTSLETTCSASRMHSVMIKINVLPLVMAFVTDCYLIISFICTSYLL